MTTTKAVKASLLPDHVPGEAFAKSVTLPGGLIRLSDRSRGELFDLTDALLCADGPVRAPVDLNVGG
nr:hypothetical protein [Streptomyces odonnellii]